jgi:hypothetical protein
MEARNRISRAVGLPLGWRALVVLVGGLAACGDRDGASERLSDVPSAPTSVGPTATADQGIGAAGNAATEAGVGAPVSAAGTGVPGGSPTGTGAAGTAGQGAAASGGLDPAMMGSAGTGGAGAGMMGSAATGGTAAPIDAGEVCARWRADRADLSEGTWNGDVATRDPGEMTEQARAKVV